MDETLGKVSPPIKEPCSIYPRVPRIDCGNFQHIFTRPHVTENLIQQLIEDLSQDGAFEEPEEVLRSGVADLGYEGLNMQVRETSIHKTSRFSSYFFHTLIKQRLRSNTEDMATETNARKLAYVPHIGRGFK